MTLLDFLKTHFITPFPVPLAVIVFLTIFQPVVFRFNRCFSSSFFNCQETKATWHSADHCGILLAFLGIVRVILKLVIMKAKTPNTPRLHCNVIGDPKTIIAHINSHNRHNRQWRTFSSKRKQKWTVFSKLFQVCINKNPPTKRPNAPIFVANLGTFCLLFYRPR